MQPPGSRCAGQPGPALNRVRLVQQPCCSGCCLRRAHCGKEKGQSLPSPALPSATQKDGDSPGVTWTRASVQAGGGPARVPPHLAVPVTGAQAKGTPGNVAGSGETKPLGGTPQKAVCLFRELQALVSTATGTPHGPLAAPNTQAGGRNPARQAPRNIQQK